MMVIKQIISRKYTIIHSKSFEGKQILEDAHRYGGVDASASIDTTPDCFELSIAYTICS